MHTAVSRTRALDAGCPVACSYPRLCWVRRRAGGAGLVAYGFTSGGTMNDNALTLGPSVDRAVAALASHQRRRRVLERPVAIRPVGNIADQVVSALLPASVIRPSHALVPLPMVDLLPVVQEGSLVYAMGRADASGTVAATQVLNALGWHTGDRVDIGTIRNVVVIRRSTRGRYTVPRKRVIVIPAAARHACGIRAGVSLLLAAAPEHQTLIVHAESALDLMMTLYYEAIKSNESA